MAQTNETTTEMEVLPAETQAERQVIARGAAPPDALTEFGKLDIGIKHATEIANQLKGVITERGLAVAMGRSEYLVVEAWVTCGMMVGVSPKTEWTQEVRHPSTGDLEGYKARVQAIRMANGTVIGAAESSCHFDEQNKRRDSGELYERWMEHGRPNRHAAMSMAQCVPLDAEILTRRGFMRYDKLEVGEPVLAYDLQKDETVWTPLKAASIFHNQPTVELRSRSFHAQVTAEHTWPVRRPAGKNQLLRKTSELKPSDSLVIAAHCSESISSLHEKDAAILGWIITDGWFGQPRRGGIRSHIDQSNPKYIGELRYLLEGDYTSETVTKPDPEHLAPNGRPWGIADCYRWSLSAAASRRIFDAAGVREKADLPRLACELTPRARAAMLDSMLKADGHEIRGGGTWRFGKRNQQ
ncbi:hypothetical protein LCGC14_2235680 [marine sediment metagenome]|uniref:Hint domain-containing protein n=1 Tax=marine sediment metagenome TaxID=412755 RepID=A0A0F9FJJ0_9ZZZZ